MVDFCDNPLPESIDQTKESLKETIFCGVDARGDDFPLSPGSSNRARYVEGDLLKDRASQGTMVG